MRRRSPPSSWTWRRTRRSNRAGPAWRASSSSRRGAGWRRCSSRRCGWRTTRSRGARTRSSTATSPPRSTAASARATALTKPGPTPSTVWCWALFPFLKLFSQLVSSLSVLHPDTLKFQLDDTIIKSIETAPNNELEKAKEIIQRIRRRELYKFCNQYSVPKEKLEYFKNITAQDIVCSQKSSEVLLKEEDVAVSNVKIDLTRGKDNPLESIKFFKDFGCDDKFAITDDRVSHLLPAYNEDRIVRVYAKKPELVEAVSEAFENLQLRMYGEKTQVLIMDKFTVRIMAYACKMVEITDAGISLVEDLFKRREPMPSMDAIYFLQPLKENKQIIDTCFQPLISSHSVSSVTAAHDYNP